MKKNMKQKMNPVIHFEMPYEDRQRMADFYTKAFGWKTQMFGADMGNYVTAQTTDMDKNGMVKTPGAINGGFFEKMKDVHYPSVVISVDDIREAMRKVASAGGKVLGGQKPGEPDDIVGIGLYAAFIDSEGNRVGMLQPTQMGQ